MITKATIEAALYAWAHGILNPVVTPPAVQPPEIPVIWQNGDGPRPQSLYLAMNLSNSSGQHCDYVGQPNGFGVTTITGNRETVLMLQAYGAASLDTLEKLRLALAKPSVLASLASSGIVFVRSSPIMDVGALMETRWEERNAMDVFLRFAQTDTDTPGLISEVNLEKDFYAPDLSTITVELMNIK